MEDEEYRAGTVLIVDDNPTNLAILIETLSQKGLNVSIAKTGEQALKNVTRIGPDIILMDVLMPGIDGFETCSALKERDETRDIPVVFMTALGNTEDIVRGFEVGGVDYIIKPIRVEEVLARVETQLALRTMQKQLQEKNAQLEEALANIKTLKGLLPICANCKKIRDDQGYWNQLESYIEKHSDASFSHGLCPDCMEALYGDQPWYKNIRGDS